jgi:hypothetical protein
MDKLDLCIGLDVGTSTTKVVIHPLYSNDSFYVVDFGSEHTRGNAYLIPTRLAWNPISKCFELPIYQNDNYKEKQRLLEKFLNKFSKVSLQPHKQIIPSDCRNLKVRFMNNEKAAEQYLRAYIALIIQYSKKWFMKEYGNSDFVRGKEIVWSINMGIPSAKFSANGENAKYLRLLKTAYNLSQQNAITENNYKADNNQDPQIEYMITPEIVAAVSSFVMLADTAAEGLYAAVDIGAGTTDVCTFRIHRKREDDSETDLYSFFKSSVKEFGVEQYNVAINKQKFLGEFRTQIGRVIWQTYRTKDPHAQEWKNYLPLILCGGGSYIPEYKHQLKDFEMKTLQKQVQCKGYRYISLPETHYICSKSIDPKRLIVAQGLCVTAIFYDDVKKYYRETEIEDIDPLKKVEHTFISKDMC